MTTQYDNYRNRVLKVARVLSWIRRYATLLLIIFITLASLIGATLILKGTVLSNQYPDDITYGDIPSPSATAFLSSVSFEYRTKNGEWSDEIPRMPGNYQVRGVGTDLAGNPRYGKIGSFAIVPRTIEVKVSSGQVVYGETPTVAATTVFGDRLVCDQFIYEDILQTLTNVTPIQSAVRALSSDDVDVTSAYNITVVGAPISIVPRKITVTVEDSSQVYDGTSLSFDKYAITEGTLVNGDILQAVFSKSLTDVGSIPNTPELCIVTANAEDITYHYQIDMIIGNLTVTHRTLIVESGNISTVYNAQEVTNGNWLVSNTTPLVPGHTFQVQSTASFVDAGIYQNQGIFQILNAAGDDKTNNYSIFIQRSDIEILPKPIQVTTPTQTWEYDGATHEATYIFVSDLLAGHTFRISKNALIENVGTISNTVTLDILSGTTNVSKNYDIQITAGSLTVTARPITVYPQDVTQYYCGAPVFGGNAILSPDSPCPLVGGHFLISTSTDSLTDVGTRTAALATVRVMYQNQDVTENYAIEMQEGHITIQKRPIQILVADAEKAYDRTPLTSTDLIALAVDPLEKALVGEHRFDSVVTNGTQTEVGSSINHLIDFKIVDENGIDQTPNYEFLIKKGTLTVFPRPIQIAVQDTEKVYDGTPLTSNKYDVLAVEPLTYALLPGDRIDFVVIEGTQTDAGSSENRLTNFKILDENDVEQIQYYDVTVKHGTLTVLPRPIKIVVQSAEKVYDGTPLTSNKYDVLTVEPLTYALLSNHRIDYVVTNGSQTDVGSSENQLISFMILDEKDVSQAQNYDVTVENGTLTVTPRPIKIAVHSAEKVYDGTPLTLNEYDVFAIDPLTYALVTGHRMDFVIIEGAQIDVGSSENRLTDFKIFDENDVEQTKNYKATIENGTLTVTPRPIKIVVQNAEKAYDGTPLTSNKYTVWAVEPLTFALVTGHRIDNVVMNGSQTDVGSSENCLTDFAILDESDAEQTQNYKVSIENGTLTITKRPITVSSGSAEKIYDGTPLVCHNPIAVEEGVLAPGHVLNMKATGTQTEVGSSENPIEGTVLDANGKSVIENYEITYLPGTLIVYKSGAFRFMSTQDEQIYFRLASYGNYAGYGNWTNAPAYSKLLDGTYSYQYLTAIALKNAGYTPTNIQIKSFTFDYPLPYHVAIGDYPYQKQTNDTASIGPYEAEYALDYYSYAGNGLNLIGNLGSYSDEELEYRTFVYDTYLWVDNETKAFMQQIIEKENFTPDDSAIIEKVANYIRSAAVYDLRVADALDNEANMIIAFLKDYKKGVCRHYAAAATVLYRTLGIPARYTVGFAQQAIPGKWVDVGIIGHAWTEIYIDGVGWIPIEVTAGGVGGSGSNSNINLLKGKLTLTPSYQYKTYDGTPLVASNLLKPNKNLDKLLQLGYTYEITVRGSQTEVGKGESIITEFRLYDYQHRDVTDQYAIVLRKGVLEVLENKPKLISVYLYQLQKYYDGLELAFGPHDYDIEGLDIGHRLELDLNISLSEVGSLSLSDIREKRTDYVEYRVFDGNVDVTHLYNLMFEAPSGNANSYIPICIYPRPLELTANSVSKDDDGTPLKPQGATITKGSLAPGHQLLSINVIGLQSGVGESVCKIDSLTVVIVDQFGTNVTKNYDISYVAGILEILDPYS